MKFRYNTLFFMFLLFSSFVSCMKEEKTEGFENRIIANIGHISALPDYYNIPTKDTPVSVITCPDWAELESSPILRFYCHLNEQSLPREGRIEILLSSGNKLIVPLFQEPIDSIVSGGTTRLCERDSVLFSIKTKPNPKLITDGLPGIVKIKAEKDEELYNVILSLSRGEIWPQESCFGLCFDKDTLFLKAISPHGLGVITVPPGEGEIDTNIRNAVSNLQITPTWASSLKEGIISFSRNQWYTERTALVYYTTTSGEHKRFLLCQQPHHPLQDTIAPGIYPGEGSSSRTITCFNGATEYSERQSRNLNVILVDGYIAVKIAFNDDEILAVGKTITVTKTTSGAIDEVHNAVKLSIIDKVNDRLYSIDKETGDGYIIDMR